jgi:hypothetical protein|uniref:YrhC-like protein n=1 Tax=Podoviridae sp. ctiuS14 TaxID=2827620 RepID=A0A8S5LMN4_9CAUD|nr:MAG TPA: YrhC-like protein [Podoviridae sp. ctiuS14]
MIKFVIKDKEGKELVDQIQAISFYILFVSFILFLGINFFAFITWTYPVLMVRTSIGLIIISLIALYVFNACAKALDEHTNITNKYVDEYFSNTFRKDRR